MTLVLRLLPNRLLKHGPSRNQTAVHQSTVPVSYHRPLPKGRPDPTTYAIYGTHNTSVGFTFPLVP
jgi:hypothetical protein